MFLLTASLLMFDYLMIIYYFTVKLLILGMGTLQVLKGTATLKASESELQSLKPYNL